ncbi:FAD-dependent oxidoreductase [Rectinema subterraneum]
MEGGVEPATDGLELAKEFERYGYAALHADVGFGDKEKRLEPMAYPQAWRSDLAKMLKDGGINIPVIGGAVRMALVPPGKSRMDWLVDYYTTILADLQVDIRTGVEANADIIMREHPDEVILAIGSDPLVPPVKGINGKNVVIYPAVLASSYPQNERVVVGGGGLVGSETALYLAENHNDVTIIEMLPDIAMGMEPISKKYLLRELEDHHVAIFRSSRIKELTENSVMFEKDGEIHELTFDHFVVAFGGKSRTFASLPVPTHVIGDAVRVGKLVEAVRDGYAAGMDT